MSVRKAITRENLENGRPTAIPPIARKDKAAASRGPLLCEVASRIPLSTRDGRDFADALSYGVIGAITSMR